MWSGSFKISLFVRRSSHICLLTWFACHIMDLHDVFSLQVFWVKVHKAIIKWTKNLFFMINYHAIHGNTTLNGEYVWYSIYRAESRLAPSQWETLLQSNALSHWLHINLESSLIYKYIWWPRGYCNTKYPPETQHKPSSHEIWFAHNLFLIYQFILKFCREHGSICAKF